MVAVAAAATALLAAAAKKMLLPWWTTRPWRLPWVLKKEPQQLLQRL
jgi:hypothetical protein